MKETKKRILSIALAFGMVLTMAGVSSVAIGISGARNAQTVANGDQNAIGENDILKTNDIQPIIADTSRVGEWDDIELTNGEFVATDSIDQTNAANDPNKNTWCAHKKESTATMLRDTTSQITGAESLKITTPANTNSGEIRHQLNTPRLNTNDVVDGSGAITFKIKTATTVKIKTQFYKWSGDVQFNGPEITVNGSQDVSTIIMKFDEHTKADGTKFTTVMKDSSFIRIWVDNTAGTSNANVYLDSFMITKSTGYAPIVNVNQQNFNCGSFEETNALTDTNSATAARWNLGKDGAGVNYTRDTTMPISANASARMIKDNTTAGNSYLNKHFGANGERIKPGTKAITFQIYNPIIEGKDNTAKINFTFWMPRNKQYGQEVTIAPKNAIQTITLPFSDFLSVTTPITSDVNLNNTTDKTLGITTSKGHNIRVDNFAFTQETGYEVAEAPVNNKVINVSSNDTAMGTVSGSASGIYKTTQSVTVTATAVANNSFNGWYDGTTLVSTDPTYTFNVTKDTELVAKFVAIPTFAVTATADPVAGGTVSGGGNIAFTTETSLIATPASGYKFAGWADSTGKILSTDLTYNFVVTEATALTAKFVQNQFVVIYKDNDGRIISTQGVTSGSNAVVPTAPTREGYEFKGWSSNGTNITADTVITAIYTRTAKRTITVTNGTISEQGDPVNQYLIGTLITVTANAPTAGNKFSHWTDAKGNKLSTDNAYSFVVATDITLTAVYVPNTEVIVKKPFITLDSTAITNTSTGVITFNAQKHMTDTGYTFKECGMIFYKGTVTGDLTLETVGMKKAKSSQQLELTGQFQMFFNPKTAGTYSARAYMIFTDNTTGNIFTVYSDNTLTVTKS